ncbi:MAG: hypothetical protein IJT66_01845 [Clostridia bacterium]|nr:hypothetical protein [Clostridia bacterium]
MERIKHHALLFSIGAFGYGLIEVLWRGYTHWSMLGAGGICFVFFSTVSNKFKSMNLFFKSLIGSGFVTTVELVFGVILNLILKKNVWDYSRLPLNIGGQICAPYSCLWLVLSFIAIPFAGRVSNRLNLANNHHSR